MLAQGVSGGADCGGPGPPSVRGLHARVLVTTSLSKAYGLPGLRIGGVVGPAEMTEALWGRTDYTSITPASLSDVLARVALEPATRRKILGRTREILTHNLALLSSWMDTQEDRFSYRPPDAGAICYTRYHASINSTEFAEILRTEMDLLVVPGDHFGMDHYLRLGFGLPAAELEEALERTASAFDAVEQRSSNSSN